VTSYIRDRNRFNLLAPPMWVRRQLAEFDPSLVIIPSREESYHLIAQRRPFGETSHASIKGALVAPDTAMLQSYGLVRVAPLLSVTGQWNWNGFPQVLLHLAKRAGWKSGLTWEQMANAADARDASEKAARRIERGDRLDHQLNHMRTIAKLHTGKTVFVHKSDAFSDLVARSAQRASSAPPLEARP